MMIKTCLLESDDGFHDDTNYDISPVWSLSFVAEGSTSLEFSCENSNSIEYLDCKSTSLEYSYDRDSIEHAFQQDNNCSAEDLHSFDEQTHVVNEGISIEVDGIDLSYDCHQEINGLSEDYSIYMGDMKSLHDVPESEADFDDTPDAAERSINQVLCLWMKMI